jgi:hypothetical protein
LVELILLLAKDAARAPQVRLADSKKWAGNPIDVDKISILDASTVTHTVAAFSFGNLSLGLRIPRLMFDGLAQLESSPAMKGAAGKKPRAN